MMQSLRLWIQRNGFGKTTIIIVILMALLTVFGLGSAIYLMFFNQYTGNKSVVTIKANDKDTILTISGKLDAEDVMPSQRFLFYTKIYTDWDIHIKKVWEGTYTIPPKTHMKELLTILKLRK